MAMSVVMSIVMRPPMMPGIVMSLRMPMAAAVPMRLGGLLRRSLLDRRRGARIDERQRLRAFGRRSHRNNGANGRDGQQLCHSHELLLGSPDITSAPCVRLE